MTSDNNHEQLLAIGRYQFTPYDVLEDLEQSGHEDLIDYAADGFQDPAFVAALLENARDDYAINGNDEAGYDESSSLVGAVRWLHGQGFKVTPAGEAPLLAAADSTPQPRSRPSDLAEREPAREPDNEPDIDHDLNHEL